MKIRFAIISSVSFWLYALVELVGNALETVIRARLIESMVNFSWDDYLIDVSGCRHVLLIVGIVSLCLFAADVYMEIRKRKS